MEIDKLELNGQVLDISDVGAIRYDEAQTLPLEQQARARKNIGVEEAVLDILLALALVPAITDVDGAVLAESDGTILLNL